MTFASHILVPTDFSRPSEIATKAAAVLAEQFGAKITLLHVHDPTSLRPSSQMMWREELGDPDEFLNKELKEDLDKIRQGLLAGVADVEVAIVHNDSACEAICEQADQLGADLIVIATHGRTGLKKLLIGSVTERVVRLANVPVLTLRSGKPD